MSSSTYSANKHERFKILLAKRHFEGTPPPNMGFSIQGGPNNRSNENNGTHLILTAAVLQDLTVGDALIYFAEHREYVKRNPDADDHHNLRALMKLSEKTLVSYIFCPVSTESLATQHASV